MEIRWYGFSELGQTHVVRAEGGSKRAPRVLEEREAEWLFYPTTGNEPTSAPSASPSGFSDLVFGLENLGNVTVREPIQNITLDPNSDKILLQNTSSYILPASSPDVDVIFDLESQRLVKALRLSLWLDTEIESLQIALHDDDGMEEEDPITAPLPISQWTLVNAPNDAAVNGVNKTVEINLPDMKARYIQIRLRGGQRGNKTETWGVHQIEIAGESDGEIIRGPTNQDGNSIQSIGFFPSRSEQVVVEGYSASGEFLGSLNARNRENQRPLLEQSLTSEKLDPYSSKFGKDGMWSSTIPWNWVREGTKLLISVEDTRGVPIVHTLTLKNLAQFSEHTLYSNKLAIFGNSSDFEKLDSRTHSAERLATGMFSIMPVSSLKWVDSEVWQLPYLVIRTSNGVRLVRSEAERRAELIAAGDDPGDEPSWEILKLVFGFRHSFANTGRGFAITDLVGEGSSPYASQTSISTGWALTKDDPVNGGLKWEDMGHWKAWGGAGWTGWTAMRAGDECGNALAHEIGHSQTMHHFNGGASFRWGIFDEYPFDGIHMDFHPWGYDTVSRRFRTWYDHVDRSGKPLLFLSFAVMGSITHFLFHLSRQTRPNEWRGTGQ